jgi:hypothetical protein
MLDEMRVLMSEVLREQVTVGQSDLLLAQMLNALLDLS